MELFRGPSLTGSARRPQHGGVGPALPACDAPASLLHSKRPKGIRYDRSGVGASVRRKEDDRLLQGRQFIADIRLAGMKDVAFVRSLLAHAKILGVTIPEEDRPSVFGASDLGGVKPIRANSGLPGFKSSDQPVLAHDKVRVLNSRAAAAHSRRGSEEMTERVSIGFGELLRSTTCLSAPLRDRAPTRALGHNASLKPS